MGRLKVEREIITMKGKDDIYIGIILLVSAIILFFFAEEFYNEAYKNYVYSALMGNSAQYKSAMGFWLFMKNIVSPFIAFLGICSMIAGVFILSKQSDKNSKSHTIIKNRFCTKCGRDIPIDAKICPYCGNDFQTISKENKVKRIVKDEVEKKDGELKKTKFCTQCGASLESNLKFCNQCGTKLR